MATMKVGSVELVLTYEELRALIEALDIADKYDYNDLWSDLRATLKSGGCAS